MGKPSGSAEYSGTGSKHPYITVMIHHYASKSKPRAKKNVRVSLDGNPSNDGSPSNRGISLGRRLRFWS
jgi:hypothetical protein